jgi:phenylacetyl-CoA:acceptor oxidoreductase subunit 2
VNLSLEKPVSPTIAAMRPAIVLFPSQRQNVWGRLAVINFTFGSAGAGLYLLSVWFEMIAQNTSAIPSPFVLRIISAGLVCVGLIAVAGEAGQPLRARFLLGNLRTSWMSRETAAAILFVPSALITSFFSVPYLIALAAGAATLFIISQGFIIYRSRAIPAWNRPILPVLFISSAFAAGSGILLMLPARAGVDRTHVALLITTAVCGAADLLLWRLYLHSLAIDESVRQTTRPLRAARSVMIGRVAPIATLLLVLFFSIPRPMALNSLTIVGVLMFWGSWAQKTGIIRTCGFLTPIQLSLA